MTSDLDALTQLNRDYIRSVQTSDVRRFDEMLADDFLCALADGTFVDRARFLERTAMPPTIANLEAHDVNVRLMGDFAIIHARTTYTTADGKPGAGLIIKDAIADITLQQVLTRPEDFDVIATLNLNGDYLSDALAAQVGGIGIAPGGNINYITGHAVFEATHGTAPKYANQDEVVPDVQFTLPPGLRKRELMRRRGALPA